MLDYIRGKKQFEFYFECAYFEITIPFPFWKVIVLVLLVFDFCAIRALGWW